MKTHISIFLTATLFAACHSLNEKEKTLQVFEDYFKVIKDQKAKWNYTTDTVKLWFDDKKSQPSIQVKGQPRNGKWAEWDEAMHATSYYDSIWYNEQEHAVQGYFYEQNDFYDLIGKGPTKTLRTYWLNDNDKISEILIYWIPEANSTTSVHLKPIVEWAMHYDSLEIATLYPQSRIIPSKVNAERWKKLLMRYQDFVANQ